MRSFVKLAYAGVSLLALSVPGMACAAEAGDEVASNGSEIVVEARRRDEKLQDVPLVVTAVTSEQVQKLNIRDFTDVQTLVPGLQLKTEANGIGGGGQLRGIQYDINTGANPTVQFYLNDAPTTALVVLQTMYDVGQIEVQRGPQGTLRGEASPSGSITVTTKRPDLNSFGGYISATGNTIGGLNFNGGIGIPVIPGVLAIRLAGAYDVNELNRVHTTETVGDARGPIGHSKSGRVTVRLEPADWISLSGSYQRLEKDSRSFDQYESFSLANPSAAASPVLITPEQRLSIQENPRVNSATYNTYNWRAQFRAAGQTLIYQGSYYDFDLNSLTNQDSANFFKGTDFYQITHTHASTSTHEVRLQNEERVAGMFDYVVGYFQSTLKSPTDLEQQTPVRLPSAFGGGLATIAKTPIQVLGPPLKETSFFGNVTVHIDDATEISGGIRHIETKQPARGLVIAGNTIPQPAFDDKGTIYALSLKHNFSPDFMVYANTGTSRRPGPNVIGDFSVAQSTLERSFLNLPPETSQNYEIGFKSTFLDKRVRLNVSAFHQTFKNFPYRNPTGVFYVNTTAAVSGGNVTFTPGVSSFNFVAPVPVEVNGGEIELSADITPQWNVGVLASYALGKIKNGTVACNDLNKDGIPDGDISQPSLSALQAVVGANNLSTCNVTQRSSFQGPFNATIQSEFHTAVSSKVDYFARGLFSFYGSALGDPTFAYDQLGSYGLLNLFTGIRDPKGMWEVSLFAKNILNTTRATSVGAPATTGYQQLNLVGFNASGPILTPSAATATSTYSVINTTPPREFGLNVRFSFGSR